MGLSDDFSIGALGVLRGLFVRWGGLGVLWCVCLVQGVF